MNPCASIGKIVHVVYQEKCLAAIIVGVNSDDTVNLQVFLNQKDANFAGMELTASSKFIPNVPVGQWHSPKE